MADRLGATVQANLLRSGTDLDVLVNAGVNVRLSRERPPEAIPPDGGKRDGERLGWTGEHYSFMRAVLQTDLGKELYRKRQTAIEPVSGNAKHNRKIYRLNYRGRS